MARNRETDASFRLSKYIFSHIEGESHPKILIQKLEGYHALKLATQLYI